MKILMFTTEFMVHVPDDFAGPLDSLWLKLEVAAIQVRSDDRGPGLGAGPVPGASVQTYETYLIETLT